jgi:capsular polysaccharide biosynthesis protein
LLEMTRSMDVLAQVATRLDLATTWSPIYLREGTLQPSEIASILMDKVKARQFRNTSMIEVRVYDRDPALAAKIANGIVEVLREVDSRKRPGVPSSLMLADAAEPGLRPILPNVPLNLVMAALVGLLLGALAMVLIVLLRQLLRHQSRTAAAG